MNFAAVLFCTVFIFHNTVKCGNFVPTKGIDDPEKRQVIPAARAARQIYNDIRRAGRALAGKQYGFLYFHDRKAVVDYGNVLVKNAIRRGRGLDQILGATPGTRRPPFWPANARNTNILMAMPKKKRYGTREQNNHGHSEYKMLNQLENLRVGFRRRNGGCPAYVILGTVLNPCFDTRVRRKFGCAQYYVEKKNEFTQPSRCPDTKFHLYVPIPDRTSPKNKWTETEDLMDLADIKTITGT